MARRKQAHLARNTQDCSDGGATKMASTKETSASCPPSANRKSLTSSALKTQNDCSQDAVNNSIEPETWEDEEDDDEYEKRSRNDRVEHEDEENDRDSDESRRNTPRKLCCELCGEKVNSQHELTVHLRQHNDGSEAVAPPPTTSSSPSHTCSLCGKRLSSAASLDRHMLVHSGERPFRCRLCGMTFTTNGNMHRHMRAHHEVEQQQHHLLHQRGDSNPSPPKRHRTSNVTPTKKKAVTETSSTAEDGRPAAEKENPVAAATTGADPLLNCPICVKSFLCKYGLQSHMESEHPTPAESATTPAEAPLAAATAPKSSQTNGSPRVPRSPRVAKTAAERPTPESDCEVGFQDLTFVDFSAQKFALIAKDYCENHLRRPSSESQAFQCRVCYRAFPIGDALALHTRAAHPAPSALTCPTCQMCFANPEALHQHARTRHRKSSSVSADCHIDKENFLALFELQTKPQHVPYQSAPRKDVDLADIRSILAVTGGNTVHPAVQSPAADSEAASPEPAAVPEADGAATPSMVNEAAKGSDERDREDGSRSDSPSGRFPCKLCPSVFPNLRALKGHNRTHLGMSPYHCSICSYASVDKSTLQRHLRTHNGERPFLCKECQYPFTTKANCERHIRKRHGKNSKQDIMAVMHNGAKDNAVEPGQPSRSVSPPSSSSSSFTYSYSSTPSPAGSGSGGGLGQGQRQQDDVVADGAGSGGCEDTVLDLSRTTMMSIADTAQERTTTPSSSVSSCGGARGTGPSSGVETDADRLQDALVGFGGFPPQDKPLDLALRPVDLSVKTRVAPVHPAAPVSTACNRGVFSLVVNGRGGLLAEVLPPSGGLARPSPFQTRNAPLNFTQPALKMMPGLVPLNMTMMAATAATQMQVPMPAVPLPVPRVHPQHVVSPVRESSKRAAATNLTVTGTIRNGVLQMKQQKQRRYRTERPFRCSHCPAGFTLRSNMERHVKQQHPEYWAAKVRGRKAYITPSPPASLSPPANTAPSPPPPLLVPATKNISSPAFPGSIPQPQTSTPLQLPLPPPPPPPPLPSHLPLAAAAAEELTNPRLVTISPEVKHAISQQIKHRKALDQQQKMQQQALMVSPVSVTAPSVTVTPAVATVDGGKPQRRPEEDDGLADLASVSRLLDTANDQSIQNMLRGKGTSGSGAGVGGARDRERDCECLSGESAEGSSSPSQSSASPPSGSAKSAGSTSPGGTSRKSAYTSAPNRVACNFCPRKFPWSSSLRRHLLTHTGQKPYKCPECPLFFTTKSNCDRHLVRKHHNPSASKERNSGPTTTSGTASAGESNQAGDDSEDPDSDGCEVSPTMDDSRGDEDEEGGEDEDDDGNQMDTLAVSPRGNPDEDMDTDAGSSYEQSERRTARR